MPDSIRSSFSMPDYELIIAALGEASIPKLMMSMLHMVGDVSIGSEQR
ncbi:MAG: hypothetical protein P8L39_07175 [Halioglobus sp.]|nr:hypothetical protein [Halioglobus sp.]